MTSVDPSDLSRSTPAEVRGRYEQAVRNLEDAFADAGAISGTGGDERTATATCTADGNLTELRISQTYLSRATTDEVAAAVRDAIRAAQDEVDHRMSELAGDAPRTPEELVAQLTDLTREATRRLAGIQQRAEELASRIRQHGVG